MKKLATLCFIGIFSVLAACGDNNDTVKPTPIDEGGLAAGDIEFVQNNNGCPDPDTITFAEVCADGSITVVGTAATDGTTNIPARTAGCTLSFFTPQAAAGVNVESILDLSTTEIVNTKEMSVRVERAAADTTLENPCQGLYTVTFSQIGVEPVVFEGFELGKLGPKTKQ